MCLLILFLCLLFHTDPGSALKSTPAFDSYKVLGELKETNVQILSEKTKLKNELSKVKKENSMLEKKLVRKKERNCILRYNTIVLCRTLTLFILKIGKRILEIS